MSSNKDIQWVRNDVLGNSVSLYTKTMSLHISKHAYDEVPVTEEHIYQTVIDPDHAHRSLDPVIGHDTCVFEKFFANEGHPVVVPVIYDGVAEPGDYDRGGKNGSVSTGYFETRGKLSSSIGEVFWSKGSGIISPRQVPEQGFIQPGQVPIQLSANAVDKKDDE